ncbi:hypothetical protein Tco_1027563, partial [Tanacetum coccineum]
ISSLSRFKDEDSSCSVTNTSLKNKLSSHGGYEQAEAVGDHVVDATNDLDDGFSFHSSMLGQRWQLQELYCERDEERLSKVSTYNEVHGSVLVIINLTSNVLVDYLVFDDVATVILEEENRRNNREDKQTSSRQVEALVVTRGGQWNMALVGVTIMVNLKQERRRRILNALNVASRVTLRKIVGVQITLILREISLALLMMVTLCVVKQRLQMKAKRDLQMYGCSIRELHFI